MEYIIGIDLGTTNCTVCYTHVDSEEICQFDIPQHLDLESVGPSKQLPSFLYFPLEKEQEVLESSDPVIGVYAKTRGEEAPDRVISSAKSWLCHSQIDRRAAILPNVEECDFTQISPLDAIAKTLTALREAWDEEFPAALLAEQKVLVTVPASFDPSARQLVQEACEIAGYPEIVLLEEPQAAFYAWLYLQGEDWRQSLTVGDTVLVVDVGGGTTDFSLISVDEEDGDLQLNRRAVGQHLLLGGDNMDLALAYLCRQKFEDKGKSIDDWQFKQLVHQARAAKEKLLGEDPADGVDVVLHGRGTKLIGGTIKTEVTREEVEQLLVDGFLPLIEADQFSKSERRAGLSELGLPFAADARISAQLAKFLSMTGESDTASMDEFVMPTKVLFNGGTLKALGLQNRLMELLNQWATALSKPSVERLEGADLDYAVSRGGAYYGLTREGQGIRIRGGTSRSYFIGVEEAMPAVPGIEPPLRAICVVPFGMEEGSKESLESQEFALVVGEQAQFRFFSHATPTLSDGTEPGVGVVVRNWKKELTELHPIETTLDQADDEGKTVRVTLKSEVTELGVLKLSCVAADGRTWQLEFDIRQENPNLASLEA